MAVFLVLSDTDRADLDASISAKFPDDQSLKVASGQWLVAGSYTPKGLSDYLELTDGKYGSVMLCLVTSYFGWHSKNIWDWIALKNLNG